jgi:phage terminase large subunit-like protein
MSWATVLASLPPDALQQVVGSLDKATAASLARMPWWFTCRPEQEAPPGDWLIWLIMSGRGWGKSRTGSETLLDWVLALPTWGGVPTEWGIIAETIGDAREICVLGPSGFIRALERRGLREHKDWEYNKSFGVITMAEGQKIHVLGADDRDAGRGYNFSGVWCDEVAKWRYSYDTWTEGIAPALRIGAHPRAIVTTTPKPVKLLRDWTTRKDGSVVLTRGSTFDNAVNLSRVALSELRKRYEGTRTGRQELHGELLTDVVGALWTVANIDQNRVRKLPVSLVRTVVAVDPAVTSGEDADETGIIVMGKGSDSRGYLLADRSMQDTPLKWATAVCAAYKEWGAAYVVIETNQGGDALIDLLHTVDPQLPVHKVTAKKSKRVRAEPASAVYEQNRISHVGEFNTLEDQITTWTPEETESPDRMDALVYAVTDLFNLGSAESFMDALAREQGLGA